MRQMPLWLGLAREGGICKEEGGVTQNVHPASCDTHTFPLPGLPGRTSPPAGVSQRRICLFNHEGGTKSEGVHHCAPETISESHKLDQCFSVPRSLCSSRGRQTLLDSWKGLSVQSAFEIGVEWRSGWTSS